MCSSFFTPTGMYMTDEDGNIICSFGTGVTAGVDFAKEDFNKGIKVTGDSVECNDDKEEENMERNRVLDLYVERKRKALKEEFNTNYENEYNELPIVKEFNELINAFETSLAELANRFEDGNKIQYLGYANDYAYEIAPSIRQEIRDKHYAVLREQLDAVDDIANEVHALLSLSDDKDYQIEVLTNYGILDKKTKQLTI